MKSVWSWPSRTLGFVRERFNRPPRDLAAQLSRFVEVDTEVDGAELQLSFDGLDGQLLVVVTTCDRTRQLDALLSRLRLSLARAKVLSSTSLVVLEDVTEADYGALRRRTSREFPGGVTWVRSIARLGKKGYWVTYQVALAYAERSSAGAVLFLQDDLEFDDDLVSTAKAIFANLGEERQKGRERPLVLNLYASDDDEPQGRWIEFSRRAHPTLPVRRTQWFDLNGYLVERSALELLDFRLVPIDPSRWTDDPTLSSGVGRQLTRRLYQRTEIYQCYPPLVFHGRETSLMNPEARQLRSLDNFALRREVPASRASKGRGFSVLLARGEVVPDREF